MSTRGTIIVALCMSIFAVHGEGRPAQAPTSQSAQWAALVDELLTAPPLKSELTAQRFFDELARTRAQLARLRALDPSRLSRDEALDRRFAESILAGREIELERMRRWRMDPRLYMASTRALVAALNDDRKDINPTAKATVVMDAMRAAPAELRQGPPNLTLNVPRFREQSVALASAATTALATSLPVLAESLPAQKAALLEAAADAQQAIVEWMDFLTSYLVQRPAGYVAIGVDAYDALLKGRDLADYDSFDLYQYARRALDDVNAEMEAIANEVDSTRKWQAILSEPARKIADKSSAAAGPDAKTAEPPSPIQMHQEAIKAARARLAALGLLPIPWKERVDVMPRPLRPFDTTYYATASGSLIRDTDGTLVSQWRVNQDDGATQNFLGPDDGSVAAVTAYTALADHVLALYQSHNPGTLRRSARSAMFADGWELYIEQRAQETGAFSDKGQIAHLRQLQLKLWRIARIVVDVGLHTGKLSEAQATTLLTGRVGLVAAAAAEEITAAADAPGAHLGYMGLVEVLRIRDEVKAQRGAQFSFTDFHDRLLKTGPLPPALIRAALIAE